MDQSEVLTGQVPVPPPWPECPEHREVYHAVGDDEQSRWCNRCGWNRTLAQLVGRAGGGWGSPSGRRG